MQPILISSCDKYLDIAYVSALSLLKYSPILKSRISFICEGHEVNSGKIKRIEDLGFNVIKTGLSTWPEILENALSLYKENSHIILLLDDFLIKSAVNVDCLNELCNFAEENDYDYLRLIPRPNNFKKNSDIKELKNRNIIIKNIEINSRFSINLQASIWKKNFLKNILKEINNPWELEIFASSKMNQDLKIACTSDDIFNYKHHSLEKGLWFPWELKRVKLLFPDFYNQREILSFQKLIIWYFSILKGFIAFKLDNLKL